MVTINLGLADTHFADKKPVSRKDDYHATQVRKLSDVLRLAASLRWKGETTPASSINIAGDVFHQPRGELISRKLDNKLARILRTSPCPVTAISGNHDMDRIQESSLEKHPLGMLVASGIVKLVHWPDYLVVGTIPPVIITGRQYSVDGPAKWLEHIAATGELRNLKREVSDDRQCEAQVLLMTHNHWGPGDSTFHGDPIVGHRHVVGTGADVVLYGHPHTYDGTVEVEEGNRKISIVGPGALVRGTLAEHDVTRKPMIAVIAHNSDGSHEVVLVPVPHEPPEAVFDSVAHERKKRQKKVEEQFVQQLSLMSQKAKTPEEILTALADKTSARILALVKQYYTIAEQEVANS